MNILLALALTSAAAPQAMPAPAATSTPVAADSAEKPVCRREIPTGSNFVKKTCHSKSEWAAIDAANGRSIEQSRNSTFNRR